MEHTVDDTAKAILDKLPEKGTFSHRKYYHQTDWDDIDIGSYTDLHALAKLWLTLPRIREALGHYQETEGRKFAFDPDGWSPAIDVLGLLESIDPSERTKLAELEK